MSVLILRPNSDVAIGQTCSTGSNHYALIDETTLDEADYLWVNYTDTNPVTIDVYDFPSHSSESGVINSVTVKAYAKYILTGTCTNNSTINLLVFIGSTRYFSGVQNLTNSTNLYSYTWTTNPETSSAWSWTNIDALGAGDGMQLGYIDKSNCRKPYKYQLWVEVDYTAGGGSTVFLPNIMKHNFIPPLIGGY